MKEGEDLGRRQNNTSMLVLLIAGLFLAIYAITSYSTACPQFSIDKCASQVGALILGIVFVVIAISEM